MNFLLALNVAIFIGFLSYLIFPGSQKRQVQGPSSLSSDRQQSDQKMIRQMKSLIPPLSFNTHKGQAGRIAVIGGSQEYTGAPYFAAISALKVGADLVYVFCAKEAAPVIKSYSPELIVLPLLDKDDDGDSVKDWLNKMHAVVIGPGLGRLPSTFKTVKNLIGHIRNRNIPLVIDADGLSLVAQEPGLIENYKNAVLTPNIVEYGRLAQALGVTSEADVGHVRTLSERLGGVVVVRKGMTDEISNGISEFYVEEKGSPRRCGGQGDLLSGSLATFLYWANSRRYEVSEEDTVGVIAAYAACALTKRCAYSAYLLHGRSTTTTNLIEQINYSFTSLFDTAATDNREDA